MVLHHSGEHGMIRYRQLEYYRMPVMNYLAMEDPRELTRGDYVRLALVTGPGDSLTLPYSSRHLQDFEYRYCYDRYWEAESHGWSTRLMSCGHAFTIVAAPTTLSTLAWKPGCSASSATNIFCFF